MTRLAIDLYCGLGGWTEGLQAAGWDVIGFDIERHVYGEHEYPAQLVLQDILTLHGSQFREAGLIVASPPCQEYSYMAMPWKRAKQIERALKGEDEFPDGYKGSRTVAELNALFDACFRIQRDASEAKGEHVPLVVENVCGAQKWVGPARWRHGSYYLWGDVPALMPIIRSTKNTGGSWFNVAHNTTSGKGANPDGRLANNARDREEIKVGGDWFSDPHSPSRTSGSKSSKRKAASAMIAKIPYDLAHHIGAVYA